MNKIKIFLTALVISILGTNAFATCTIRYDCGTGASGTAPTSQSIRDETTVFTPATPTECTKEGSVFSHWLVTASGISGVYLTLDSTNNTAQPNINYTIPYKDSTKNCSNRSVTIVLTSQWTYPSEYFVMPTSKSYVDAQLNGRQPQFSGLGNDKLMLYSSTTDGALGSRDIVTTLGDSTTANTIPTRGAIVTGFDTKQDLLNGEAGWVVENTGTAGSVKAKPVYSTTNNYTTALVEAGDLNQIVVDAVNSELIPVEGVGWQINTAANLTLPTLRMLMPDVSANGTDYCSRPLDGTDGDSNSCGTTATIATLGATGSKSGLWAAVMPYGDIVGKSVCSATAGTANTAATDAQESSITTEFNNQTGVGESALRSSQKNCWCKMILPSVSRWVFTHSYSYSHSSSGGCSHFCAYDCASEMRFNSDFRSALFNSVQ